MKPMRGFGARAWRVGVISVSVMLAANCGGAPGKGTLSGHLFIAGGPLPLGSTTRPPQPVSGHVVARSHAGAYTATAGSDGRYTMRIPPGTYVVTGTSPNYNDSHSPCPADKPITVLLDQARNADVYCQVP